MGTKRAFTNPYVPLERDLNEHSFFVKNICYRCLAKIACATRIYRMVTDEVGDYLSEFSVRTVCTYSMSDDFPVIQRYGRMVLSRGLWLC